MRVRMNVLRSLGRGIQWLAAMILGGVLTELALIGMRIFEKYPSGLRHAAMRVVFHVAVLGFCVRRFCRPLKKMAASPFA